MKHLSQKHATTYALFFLSVGLVLLTLPSYLFAAPAQYTPLVGIPGVQTTPGNLPAFLNRLYLLTISIGAIFATIKIVMAGVKWSLTEIVTDKSDAKQDIKGALFGLAILLVPFIVLSQIYPNLTSMNVLQSIQPFDLTVTPSGAAGGASNQGLADTNPNSTTAPTGMTFQNCTYDRTHLAGGNPELAVGNEYTYFDSSACEATCKSKNGTFLPLGIDSGRCTYQADPASNNTPDPAVMEGAAA